MPRCSRCGSLRHLDQVCARCGDDAGQPAAATGEAGGDPSAWSVVARFGNAAEAGYFANELDFALGLEPRLECRDDFDALHHHWRFGYVLSVPRDHADRACEILTALLDGQVPEMELRDEPSDDVVRLNRVRSPMHDDAQRCSGSHLKWAPLFLTLAAGSLAVWHGRKLAPVQPPARPDALRVELGDAPGLHDAPWIQAVDGGARRELHFRGADGDALLREDRDGDGVFEREMTVETR